MFLIGIEKLGSPEFLISEEIVLSSAATRESEPLHVIGETDVFGGRIIETGMSRCSGNNCRQVRWEFFRRCPLIKPRVRTAPHRNFAVAIRLFCEPLDQVVSIPWIIYKRLEFAGGISATTNVDKQECIAMQCEVRSTRVVTIRDVRRQREDHWRLW